MRAPSRRRTCGSVGRPWRLTSYLRNRWVDKHSCGQVPSSPKNAQKSSARAIVDLAVPASNGVSDTGLRRGRTARGQRGLGPKGEAERTFSGGGTTSCAQKKDLTVRAPVTRLPYASPSSTPPFPVPQWARHPQPSKLAPTEPGWLQFATDLVRCKQAESANHGLGGRRLAVWTDG